MFPARRRRAQGRRRGFRCEPAASVSGMAAAMEFLFPDALALLAQDAIVNVHDRAFWSDGRKIGWILHVLGIILWVGGLLLLTRLLGYHMKALGQPNGVSDQSILFRIEKRMHWLVVFPGLILALLGGLLNLIHYASANMKMGWFHAKLTIALIFLGLQIWTIIMVNKLAADPPSKKTPIFSIIHGLAGLLLIVVLILIRFTPF
jgi:putative membrane protein